MEEMKTYNHENQGPVALSPPSTQLDCIKDILESQDVFSFFVSAFFDAFSSDPRKLFSR